MCIYQYRSYIVYVQYCMLMWMFIFVMKVCIRKILYVAVVYYVFMWYILLLFSLKYTSSTSSTSVLVVQLQSSITTLTSYSLWSGCITDSLYDSLFFFLDVDILLR